MAQHTYNENIEVKECYGWALWAGVVRQGFGEETRHEGTVKARWVWRSGWNIPDLGRTQVKPQRWVINLPF